MHLVETSWISRHSGLPANCNSMRNIDGEEFYKKYLLNVKFKGKQFIQIKLYDIFRHCQHKSTFYTRR